MNKWEKIFNTVKAAGGQYETRKFKYWIYYGLHTVLVQYDKTTGKYFTPYTIL
jgi:hypothetical protein